MAYNMKDDCEYILLSSEQIQQRVAELAAQINKDYEGKDLLVVCILKGAVVFFSDLFRQITVPCTMDFMSISSYGASTKSSGVVRVLKDLDKPIEGKDVLIVEDIVDSGLSLKYLLGNLASRGPASVKICTLLDKPDRRKVELKPDYSGFTIPNAFVVGYGLDYNELYRNLPDVGVLKPSVYGEK